jgi:hypothetical protein
VGSDGVTVATHSVTLFHLSDDVRRVSLVHQIRDGEAFVLWVSVVKVNADNGALVNDKPTINT